MTTTHKLVIAFLSERWRGQEAMDLLKDGGNNMSNHPYRTMRVLNRLNSIINQ